MKTFLTSNADLSVLLWLGLLDKTKESRRLKTYGVCPLEEALEDFLLPKPRILNPLLPSLWLPAVLVNSGLEPFLAAKSWKLRGGAEPRRGLLLPHWWWWCWGPLDVGDVERYIAFCLSVPLIQQPVPVEPRVERWGQLSPSLAENTCK